MDGTPINVGMRTLNQDVLLLQYFTDPWLLSASNPFIAYQISSTIPYVCTGWLGCRQHQRHSKTGGIQKTSCAGKFEEERGG